MMLGRQSFPKRGSLTFIAHNLFARVTMFANPPNHNHSTMYRLGWKPDLDNDNNSGDGNINRNTIRKLYVVSWEPEGRYCRSKMFRWEPERRYCCTKSIAIAPFWFSTEHLWIAITPFWLSTDELCVDLCLHVLCVFVYVFINTLQGTENNTAQ